MPLFTKVGDVMLEARDRATLEHQLACGQAMVAACPNHKRDRCDCWLAIRQYVWDLQRTLPDAPITKAAETLWTVIEDYAKTYTRPTPVSPEVQALVTLAESIADAQQFPLGKRSEAGIEHRKARKRR